MITLNGASGKGTLLCTFRLPDFGYSGKAYVQGYSHLDYAIPPSDWYLPPPDKVWYPVVDSVYGPRLSRIHIGDIQSVDKDANEWNPCKHTTIKGDALYLGPSGQNAPYWRKPATNCLTTFTGCNLGTDLPSTRFLATLAGRPCTVSDPLVHSRTGELVRQSLSGTNGQDRYYYYDTILPANIAPEGVRSSLTQLGQLHRNGQWYCRQIYGQKVVNPVNNVHWYKTDWSRPNRTTYVRDLLCEYHMVLQSVPAASRAFTRYGNVAEANQRKTTCVITHVMSESAGRFLVKFDVFTELSWFGYETPGYYKGSSTFANLSNVAAVLVLEPGLTAESNVSTDKANKYCELAVERSSLLYDHKLANSARTMAIRDVQALDSNWIENLAGVKGTLDCVNPLIDGYNSMVSGDLGLAKKALAGGYLTYKYAIAPNISDAKDLSTNLSRVLSSATQDRFSKERRRGAAHKSDVPVCDTLATLSFYTTLHLRLKNNYFSQVWSGLEKLGIDPSAGKLWDLIPFSFVADWFMPLGDSLKNIDAYNSMFLHRDLLGRIESFKVQWPLEEKIILDLFDGSICSSGSPLRYSWYDRRVFSSIGPVDPISISDGNGLTQSQMIQGAALLTVMNR